MKRDAIKEARPQAVDSSILVIGYGNPLRRDDGAGPAVAEKLAQRWSSQGIAVRVNTDIQLTPEMVEEIAADPVDAVVFVDARVHDSSLAFQISPVDANAVSPTLGHQLEPATLLVYAAALYGRTPRAWLVTVPGVDFGHGQGFSVEVEELLRDVGSLAEQLCGVMKETVRCMN